MQLPYWYSEAKTPNECKSIKAEGLSTIKNNFPAVWLVKNARYVFMIQDTFATKSMFFFLHQNPIYCRY